MKDFIYKLLDDLAQVDTDLALLVFVVCVTAIVIDSVTSFVGGKRKEVGLSKKSETISLDGSERTETREYISLRQGLAGRPDAIILENGFKIPVEHKPLARKLRDRYVAQLLVYMRLIEEFEGQKPPYGYLVLGAKCRRVKIENTPQRQAWLQKHINQMNAILHGAKALPAPQQEKCRRCDVKNHCAHRWPEQVPIAIGQRKIN